MAETKKSTGGKSLSSENILARDVIQSLVKSTRAFKMYLPNNPLHQKFFDDFFGKLQEFLESEDDLNLSVSQATLSREGEVIYENHDLKESFAFKLYSDGILGINFLKGISPEEVKAFLEIVGGAYDSDDDDIATRLWLAEFSNINYLIQSDQGAAEVSELGMRKEPSEATSEETRKAAEEAPELKTPVMMPQQMILLTPEELKWLEEAKEKEEKSDPVEEISHILLSIIEVEKDEHLFDAFKNISVQMIRDLIRTAKLDAASKMIRSFQKLAMSADILAKQREGILFSVDEILDEELAIELGRFISENPVAPASLHELLLLVGRSCPASVCHLLGELTKNDGTQKVVSDFLTMHGGRNSGSLITFLGDSRSHLVSTILQILTEKKDFSAIDAAGKLAKHSEEKIRRDALKYIKAGSSKAGIRYLFEFLEDTSLPMRIRTLKVLGSPIYADGVNRLLDIIRSDDFEKKEMSEKVAFLESLADNSPEKALFFMGEELKKKHWFNKTREIELTACLAAGLARINSVEALSLCEDGAKAKKGEARQSLEQAAKTIRSRLESKGGEKS